MPLTDHFFLALVLAVFGVFSVALAYGSIVASGKN